MRENRAAKSFVGVNNRFHWVSDRLRTQSFRKSAVLSRGWLSLTCFSRAVFTHDAEIIALTHFKIDFFRNNALFISQRYIPEPSTASVISPYIVNLSFASFCGRVGRHPDIAGLVAAIAALAAAAGTDNLFPSRTALRLRACTPVMGGRFGQRFFIDLCIFRKKQNLHIRRCNARFLKSRSDAGTF